jgi:hypothetical protein
MYLSDFALLGAFIKWGMSGFKGKFKDFYDEEKYLSVRLAYLGLVTLILVLILIVIVLSQIQPILPK